MKLEIKPLWKKLETENIVILRDGLSGIITGTGVGSVMLILHSQLYNIFGYVNPRIESVMYGTGIVFVGLGIFLAITMAYSVNRELQERAEFVKDISKEIESIMEGPPKKYTAIDKAIADITRKKK